MILERLFVISWAISAISLATQMLLSYLLIGSLRKNHALYYKSIGEPNVIVSSKLKDAEEEIRSNYIRVLKGSIFVYRMVFRGIPKRFPREQKLRRLALSVRIVATITLVSFAILIAMGYLFYKSDL